MKENIQSISITVDDRESNSTVAESLLGIEMVVVRVERLPIGDYQADNRLLFERKTLKDFASSIIDGRLFDQMIRLAGSSYTGILILEGTGSNIADGIRTAVKEQLSIYGFDDDFPI